MAVRLVRARCSSGASARWVARYRRHVALVSCGVVVSVALTVVQGVPALAAPVRPGPNRPVEKSVSVGKVAPRAGKASAPGPVWRPKALTAPVAASADVAASGAATKVGMVPVAVSPVAAPADDALVPGRRVPDAPATPAGPSSVQVAVKDAAAASALSVNGLLLTVARSDGAAGSGSVRLSVDATSFADASGGDFVNRLRLVSLPACALTTPSVKACQTRTDLHSTNRQGVVSADVPVPGDPTATSKSSQSLAGPSGVVALAAGTSSPGMTFEATSLSPSASWTAGTQGGSFSYSYPMKVPAGLGGPTPDLALTYDSASADGQTLAANGQTSWVGQGWDLQAGYIERSFRSCGTKAGAPQTPDLCWFSYNATMVFQGHSTDLVRDDGTGNVWHAADDSGMKIEDLSGASNGVNNGEYWRVTTQDGTQYYFGLAKRYAGDSADTQSALGEPVYATNAGEPCYNPGGYASSWCRQGYRWNLDYVVDPRGNTMTYFYSKLVGYVGANNNTNVQPYDMSSVLVDTEYGTRKGSEDVSRAPMRVVFATGDRCWPDNPSPCDQHVNWPDTPWDTACWSATSCPNTMSPVYFSAARLTAVITQVRSGTGYRNVDEYDLDQTFLASPDGLTGPDLWLSSVTHTGFAADGSATLSESQTEFSPTGFPNRKDYGPGLGPAYYHYRIEYVDNGMLGSTAVTYNPSDCASTWTPDPGNNPNRCFPQYFKPAGADAVFGWFLKYTVASVQQVDQTGGSPTEQWDYQYSTVNSSSNVLWHYNMADAVPVEGRTWSTWRGYSTVTTTHGEAGGPQDVTTAVYYRGMYADRTTAGGWNSREVNVMVPAGVPQMTAPVTVLGKCIDDAGGSTTNGNRIQIWDCNQGANQQITATDAGELQAVGKCLDITGAGTANGTPVQLWDCSGGANQKWAMRQDGRLVNPVSGRCLDLPAANTTNGTQLDIGDCTGTAQNWQNALVDTDVLAGRVREQYTIDGTIVSATTHMPNVTQTASQAPVDPPNNPTKLAYLVDETTTMGRSWVAATGSWRWTGTNRDYDSYGDIDEVMDYGDLSTPADDVCTYTDYATRDTTNWLINFPSRVRNTDCAPNPTDADYLSGSLTNYDGRSNGQAPTQGLVTTTKALASVSGATLTWKQTSRADYDDYGRPIASYDALDHKTTTGYTPALGGPVTQVTVTNPKGWTTTTTIEPGHGNPLTVTDVNGKVTTAQYDPLGRLVKGWSNNRPTTSTPNVAYTYHLSWDGTSWDGKNWVQTQKLGPNGTQVTSYQIYDGFLRPRQTQTPTSYYSGDRVITDTAYNSRGLVIKTSTFWNSSPPDSALVSFADTDVANQHRYVYDNQGRQIIDAQWINNVSQWETDTAYDGDRATVTPPAGGTATRTLTNARGTTIELDQYLGATPSGSYQATTYDYDLLGRQKAVHDPAGNTWTTSYDLRGRIVGKTDPDTGASTLTYDDAGELLTTTDARSITLTNVYDNLGRKTAEWQGPADTGAKLLDFTYDTLALGQVTTANRYASGGTYSSTITGYNDAHQPLGTTVTIPASEGFSPNSWTTSQTYNVDGSVATTTLPAVGGLAQETIAASYDDFGSPLTMTGLDTYVSGTWTDAFGHIQQVDLGADHGVHLAAAYDEATGRLAETWAGTGGDSGDWSTWTFLLDTGYGWDEAGNLTDKTTAEADGTTNQECFQYDGLRQLTQAWTTTASACQTTPRQAVVGGPDPYWQTYTYDNATGNRKTMVNHATTGNTTGTYTYPTGHTQPHTLTAVTLTGASTGTSSYGYDPAGNTTTRNPIGKPGQTLTWDPEGHLATLTANSNTTSYIYDAVGNRLIAKDNTGETLYLGPTEIHRTTTGATNCTRYYSYNGGVVAVRTDPGTLTWQADDNHGTAQLTINTTTKTVASRLRTDPFGNPRNTNPWPTTRGFINGVTDPTGLTHLGAREYDPATGRFTSADPILNVADPQQLGGYTYAGNNPTTTTDPNGTCTRLDVDGPCITYTPNPTPPPPTGVTPSCNYSYCKGPGSSTSTTPPASPIPADKVQQLNADINMIIKENPKTWNIPGSNAYDAMMVRIKNTLYGDLTWGEVFDGTKGVLASSVISIVGAALCAGTDGIGCLIEVGVIAAVTGQCVDDCSNAKALGLAAVFGAVTGGLPGGAGDDHILLGLESDGLDGLAGRIGARTLMNDTDWKGTVYTAGGLLQLGEGGAKVSISLDDMQGADDGVQSAVGASLLRNARQIGGATDLEITMLNDFGVLGDVDFYINGELQPNPY